MGGGGVHLAGGNAYMQGEYNLHVTHLVGEFF